MKSWLTVLISIPLLSLGTNCFAIDVEGGAYVGIYSKYLSSGFDLSDGEPVLQAGIDLSAYGVTLGYWSNYQLRDGHNPEMQGGEATETDVMLDYTVALAQKVSLSVGDTHCTYNVPGSDNEMYLGFAFDAVLAPKFIVYYNWGGLDRLYYTLAVGHDFTPMDNMTLALGALARYNQKTVSIGDYSAFHNIELTASAGYALAAHWSLSGELIYSDALSTEAKNAGISGEIVGGLNVGFTF